MKEIIIKKLKEIEEKENVKIIFAIESGSRAWGFESPDSDYDVRFVYVRNRNDYLRIDKYPDVLEYEISDLLDIVGWDLSKALFLLKKSNPSLFEWINAPIVYMDSELFQEFKQFSKSYYCQKTLSFHYYNMAKGNYEKYILDKEQVIFKKYFYVLRPLLACKYVLEYNTLPPMKFEELLKIYGSELDMDLINQLLQRKSESTEKYRIEKLVIINEYILKTFTIISDSLKSLIEKKTEFDEINGFLIKGIDLYEN